MKILIGPAGTAGLGYEEGIKKCTESGLKCLEVEFTYGVRMTNEEAKKVGKWAKENNVKLSVHAPYYINLASKEKTKVIASRKRILMSCEKAHYMEASPVVFHAGYYMGREPEKVYETIKKEILLIQSEIKKKKWKVKIAPETTGKKSQFAGLEELLRLRKETGCEICVDFAHLFARTQGKIDYNEVIKKVKGIEKLHCHFSGINYGEKGERNHIALTKKFFEPLRKALKKASNKEIRIINESPEIFKDAMNMKKWLKNY